MQAVAEWESFLAWLISRHKEIKMAEDKAKEMLESNDPVGYRAHLQKKAELVADLLKDSKPYVVALEPDLKDKVTGILKPFAMSAAYGLSLGSPFYWSALLYRDDHGKDEPDNLQCVITKMQDEGPDFVV
ncbi:MAG: hypothetical protein IJU79_00355 [Desulfovibrionaceae bacterium]|nr:hypothetical protein [Desulfovibrionaceae bacterium]